MDVFTYEATDLSPVIQVDDNKWTTQVTMSGAFTQAKVLARAYYGGPLEMVFDRSTAEQLELDGTIQKLTFSIMNQSISELSFQMTATDKYQIKIIQRE